MKPSLIPVVLAMAIPSLAQGQKSSSPIPDSATTRAIVRIVSDSISALRDSIASASALRATDAIEDARPARRYLRNADSSLLATVSGSVADDYPLGPGDVIVLNIWGQKQASYELTVDRDGQIQIPAAGVVNLNGATFGSAHRLIGRKLSSVYSGVSSGGTQFDITLAKLKQVRVFVVGEVRKPGAYLLSGATSALQAVALAGGPTPRGSDRVARVVRDSAVRDIDLYQYLFLGRRPMGDVLHDGEVVRVPPAQGTAEVTGAAARPGIYEVLPGETSQSLLQLAGGLSPDALVGQPYNLVRRSGGGTYTVLVGTGAESLGGMASSPVGPGDVLEIPKQGIFLRTSPVVTGAVARPGTYPWSEGLGLRKLIEMAGGPSSDALTGRILIYRDPQRPGNVIERLSLASDGDLTVNPSDSVVVPSTFDSTTNDRWVRIDGAVLRPGTYRWSIGITARDLLALAGGAQPWGLLTKTRIDFPAVAGRSSSSRTLDLDGELSARAGDVPLEPYSMLGVPSDPSWTPASVVTVVGLVERPGSLVLLSPRERVSSVISRAGGLLPEAYGSGATLKRPTEGRVPFDLSAALESPGSSDDVEMLDGDSLIVSWVPSTVRVRGEINQPGTALWRKGKDWKWYIENAGGFTDSAQKSAAYVVRADGSIQTVSGGISDPTPGSEVVVPRLVPPERSNTSAKISAFGVIASAIATLVTAWAIYMSVEGK